MSIHQWAGRFAFLAIVCGAILAAAPLRAEQSSLSAVVTDADRASALAATNVKCHVMLVAAGFGAPDKTRPACDTANNKAPKGQASPNDLNYNGGPVIANANEHFLLLNCAISCWGNPSQFLTDLFASNFIHVTDQYTNLFTPGRYGVGAANVALSVPEPHYMEYTDVDAAVIAGVRTLNPGGGGGGYAQIYNIMLPAGQDTCFEIAHTNCYSPDNPASFKFCAYHSSLDSTDAIGNPIHIIYTVMPYDNVSGCRVSSGPNGSLVDSINNVLSHETIETITDPDGNAWYRNSDNQEIGDICNFNLQNPVSLNTRAYAIQMEYSNVGSACEGSQGGMPRTATHDLNGDGASDILWRNTNGTVALWEMRGGQTLDGFGVANVTTDWKIVGTGDFSGVGNSDILWQNTNGTVVIWQMSGGKYVATVGGWSVPPGWQIAGTGDFNGDGRTDILWRNTSGVVVIWEMNGGQAPTVVGGWSVSTDWQIAGTGDFNGDGTTDILWRNTNGTVLIWAMSGGNYLATFGGWSADPSWQIAGTGDFNGDGSADILWRNTSGVVVIWEMNGGQAPTVVGGWGVTTDWQIAGVGDFNGDGKSDILWRNASGALVIWEVNGGQVIGVTGIGGVTSDWQVANFGR